jgi:hypothetical protein
MNNAQKEMLETHEVIGGDQTLRSIFQIHLISIFSLLSFGGKFFSCFTDFEHNFNSGLSNFVGGWELSNRPFKLQRRFSSSPPPHDSFCIKLP